MPPQNQPITPSPPPVPDQPAIPPQQTTYEQPSVTTSAPPAPTQASAPQPAVPVQTAQSIASQPYQAPQMYQPAVAGVPMQPQMQLNPAYGHDKLAVASLVLGIVSLPASILTIFTLPIPVTGIVLGIISLKRNKGLAIAGIILSIIGIALSVGILVMGVRSTSQKQASRNGSIVTTKSGSGSTKVTSNCYSFNLPTQFVATDIIKNEDCLTSIVKEDSTEDIVINSTSVRSQVSAADTDVYLKGVAAATERLIGDKVTITSREFITIDGVRAYKGVGGESSGNYKYGGYLVALAPRDYTSDSGSKLKAFIIAYDSATSQDRLTELAQAWHWQ